MLYNGQSLEPLKFQFKDYAEWEASFMETSAYVKQKEFWLKSFEKPVSKLELPQVNDVELATPNQGSNIVFQIDPKGVEPVLASLEKDDITTFAVFYTYVSLTLLQLTGQEDFVIGLGTSGRIQEEIQPNIGMFVKSLPIRYEFELQKSFRTIVKEVNQHLMNAINNELYDLGDIIREVRKKGNQEDDLFNVMFTYLNYDFDEMSPVGQDFQPYNFDKTEVKFPMNFVISEPVNFNSNYEVAFDYNHQYFNVESASEFVSAFKDLIERVPEKLDEKIYDLVVAEQEVDYDLEDDITFNF
jgi:non-ribosomal peptide synthetase component F